MTKLIYKSNYFWPNLYIILKILRRRITTRYDTVYHTLYVVFTRKLTRQRLGESPVLLPLPWYVFGFSL